MNRKLITILGGCSALAATITPISLTSCANKKISWSEGETYTPMTPKEFTEPFKSFDDVTVAYHEDLIKNKLIWCDDKIYYLYVQNQKQHEYYNIQKMSCSIGNVGDIEDFTWQTVNSKIFRVDFNLTITAEIVYGNAKLKFDNRSMKFKNIPVKALPLNLVMGIKADVAELLFDKEWSITYPELIKGSDGVISVGSKNITYDWDTLPDDSEIRNTLIGLMQKTVDMETNYFSKAFVEL